MKKAIFHTQESLAIGVRLHRSQPRRFRPLNQHPLIRILSALLTLTLFFSGSPALFALSARAVMGGGGGKGSSANLQNAGAASASLTATRARALLQQTDSQVAAMKALQANARALLAPAGTPNGLSLGWLEPKDGIVNGTPVTTSWKGASVSSANGANNVNIKQTTQNAYLYWKSFSVGPNTTVNFDQSSGGNDVGNWIAFNKVMGNVSPSHIYGSITAQGQVYILNQNGILFHNGSQVNTHALVASTLPINENLAGDALKGISARGIANNPDYQFLFTALPIAAGINGPTGAFTPTINGSIGDVIVEQGASITSPANASHTGGLVALIGPNVRNSGSITTPNGQTILAAGLQVGLTPHPSSDPSLRGMDTYVGKVSDPSINTVSGTTGTAENSGILSVSEGNATIAGAAVRQYGVIDSSTSVSLNGRIDLHANYNSSVNPGYNANGTAGAPVIYQNTGSVDIGSGSVMRILPEWSSSDTIVGSALSLNSIVSITGQDVHLGSGAVIQAPGAVATAGALSQTGAKLLSGVSVTAGSWLVNGNTSQFIYNQGKISIDQGAQINVAGSTGIYVDSSKNFLKVQLRGSELANSPLQRTGVIRGASLTLDERITGSYNGQYWIGTPLGDATGYPNLIEHSVGELTSQGGSVSLSAGDSVVMQGGSAINVSGGWLNYTGGNFATTKLIYQGHLIDVSQATPDRVYSGIYTGGGTVEKSSKWGVSKTYSASPLDPAAKHYEAPYVSGAAGGSISIQAPSVVLNGSLEGETVAGPRQVRSSTSLSTLPVSSALTINLFSQSVVNNTPVQVSPYAPSVSFAYNGTSSQSSLVLSPDLVSTHGFGNLTILNHDGMISLSSGTVLDAGVNGSVSLEAANINIEGSIKAPGGSVSLTADLSPYSVINAVALSNLNNPSQPIVDVVVDKSTGQVYGQYGVSIGGVTQVVDSDGSIVSLASAELTHLQAGVVRVGAGAQISTAGTLGNDRMNSLQRYQPIALNGGQIAISGYQSILEKGGVLDVSGGALLIPGASTVYGNAGAISLSGGQDSQIKDIHGGSLTLGSTLSGYAGQGGSAGTLSLTAPAIQIGGKSSITGVLNLTPEFFSQGGFGTFNLTGIGREIAGTTDFIPGVSIAAGTLIHPEVASVLDSPAGQGSSLSPFIPSAPYRSSPAISMVATGLSDANLTAGSQLLVRGDLMMGEGASITLDPQIKKSGGIATASSGSLTFYGNTVSVLGSITVPGGTITVGAGAIAVSEGTVTVGGGYVSNDPNPQQALVTVDLGPTARLSTAGEALFVQDPLRVRQSFGTVLSGGVISISGNILAEAGAQLNASGASGLYDLLPSQLGVTVSPAARSLVDSAVTPYQIDTAGGSISLNGTEMLYSDATLAASSGGSTAPGGNLSVSSGKFYQKTETKIPTDLNLAVSQSGRSIPNSFLKVGNSAVGQAMPASGGISAGGGHVTIDSFSSGGFDNVILGGNLIFNGPIALSVPGSLRVATKGFLSADSRVDLTASYVSLGTPFALPLASDSSALSSAFGTSTDPSYLPPTYGTGRLNITAKLIDLGNLSLQNIGSANLVANGGVIRGDGTFDIAGDLVMQAAQIYPVTGVNFTVAAYNHNALSGQAVASGGIDGSIVVQQRGMLNLPLSAGGSLSLYAATITQGGELIAPFGTINLGSMGDASSPTDPVSGMTVPTAKKLTLTAGSITSVSGVDPLTGVAISVPYGTSLDGTSWVDPSGTPITTSGLKGKSVNLAAQNLITEKGSLVDLQGGGNITANQWISGLGGTINLLGNAGGSWSSTPSYAAGDLVTYKGNTWSARQANSGITPSVGIYWTKVPQSYAIIPGYQSPYAPSGYSDGSIGVGSQIRISGGAGLSAGTYTLLPAIYATQPGAYLITPSTAASTFGGSTAQPDGSTIVSGVRVSSLDTSYSAPRTTTLFQLFSPSLVAKQVQYQILDAGSFFSSLGGASKPSDAANLVFKATTSMALNGAVLGQGANGGRGASIDISTPRGIDITADGTGGSAGDVVLSAASLSSWSFGSLLIGGLRGTPVNGLTPLTVSSEHVNLSLGASLVGNDVILAANDGITVGAGSSIASSGASQAPDENLSVTGHGVLLRVSSDQNTTSVRTIGTDSTAVSGLSIGAGASLSGAAITLDSSGAASLDSSAVFNGQAINITAGKIAINFDGSQELGSVLNLTGSGLNSLSSAQKLNLASYSSIDFHGNGALGSSSLGYLGLHAGEILGDNGGVDTILASTIQLDNANGSTDPSAGAPIASGGSLTISGSILTLGSGNLSIGGFQNITANMSGGVQGSGSSGKGSLVVPKTLTLNTPVVTGIGSANTSITAGGNLNVNSTGSSLLTPGLGASFNLKGATVSIAAPIYLPSGSISLKATTGDLSVSSLLDVGGTAKQFFDVTQYTSGGVIDLSADNGNINLANGSTLDLSAQSGAGSAGSLSVATPKGSVVFDGSIMSTALNGTAGNFTADLNAYNGGNLTPLEGRLTVSGFTQSQNIRLRSGDLTVGSVKAHSYTLSADSGSITVNGIIDASGVAANNDGVLTGGSIALQANGNVTVDTGSQLTVQADQYDAAGKGGSIFLSAGTESGGIINNPNATLNLQNGSILDLGVTATARTIDAAGDSDQFGGVLHLRTPQTALSSVNLSSAINGASSIEVEGYKLYTVSGSAGNITPTLQNTILSGIKTFYGAPGVNSATATTILAGLDASLTTANRAILNLAPGVEIINTGGGITLPQVLNSSGVSQDDWNLAPFRVGANSAPGFMTLRAAGNITFNASLSDGFNSSAYNAILLSQNTLLPANFQSWSYQITAGSDLSAANAKSVTATASLVKGIPVSGNVALGVVYKSGGQNKAPTSGVNAQTSAALSGSGYNYYQVIRTGTGDISIDASGDLQLWNQFSSIYTTGVQVTDPTLGGTFDIPQPKFNNQNSSLNTVLGAAQQATAYAPEFSYGGGNITVNVKQDITHLTQDINHNTIADSVSELPSNWLYRRGAVDPVTGTFLQTTIPVSEVESTTWWVDFSNFFDDFGALGGGNIVLKAGDNNSNINASIPTNFRMPGKATGGTLIQAGSVAGTELGGGNLSVNAGNNLDAGVYYVERGNGSLKAGGSIITNPTRDPNHTASFTPTKDDPLSYLPTTLFMGKGDFDVQANGNVLLGPVANVFLSPQGVNNSYWYKDYFSTYAPTDQVNIQSLGGNITLRESAVTALLNKPEPLLQLWMQGFANPASTAPANISSAQPWLRLAEPTVDSSLATLLSINSPSLSASALSGNITIQGNYITTPSPVGNISLVAEGGINGLAQVGLYYSTTTSFQQIWQSSKIILSDANPASIPGVGSPISQRATTPVSITTQTALINYNGHTLMQPIATGIGSLFSESGSYTGNYGVLQTKLQLHDSSLLHAEDSIPLQIYAESGDISGLTLFSAKQSVISAGGDITDIGLYIQNNAASDVSVVSAGGSIIAYDPLSPLQKLAQAAFSGSLQSGDLQISGPGTLEVLAGGNVDLGNGINNSDGTGVGVTSIGNLRNPALPFAGADIIVDAGIKLPAGLSSSGGLALANFASSVLAGPEGAIYLSELSDALTYSGNPLTQTITAESFSTDSTQLTAEEKAKLELQLFYIVLRDTGRNHNKVGSSGYGNYTAGEQAIQSFFGNSTESGNVTMWSQNIRTKNGGNIDIFAPGGGLKLASTASGSVLTPPGIVTEHGGAINIYTKQNVDIGIGRIFTLRGGDIMIWSDQGNIAAGSSAKTVATAPPTRVLIDPQSGNVQTDLAGLATGGGIGVLATVVGVAPGNVDLIAPSGVIDAGDAGIRSSGNLNLAATKVLNADNIAASGTTSGAPPAAPPPAAPNVSGATAASTAGAASTSAAENATKSNSSTDVEPPPSVISVEVLGYGGGDGTEGDSSTATPAASTGGTPPPQASL